MTSNFSCADMSLPVGAATKCSGDVTVPPGMDLNTNTFAISAVTPKGSTIKMSRNFYTASMS